MDELNPRLHHLAPLVGISLTSAKRKAAKKLFQPVSPAGYVYVIRCESFIKIGIAMNPETRLKEMQVGNPFPLVLVRKFYSDNARRDERKLHRMLQSHRHRGEWFKVSDAFENLLASWRIDGIRSKY